MKRSAPIRVLLVDDHPVVREGLKAIITRTGTIKVVAEAGNKEEAVSQFFRHRPDVTLMDLRIPDSDGIDAIEAIRRKAPHARIIVVTSYGGEDDVYRAFRAGARAYLLKDAPRNELLDCIRSVHAGAMWISPMAAARLAERANAPEFTPRESEVVRLLVSGQTNKEIATSLNIAEGTVKIHVNRILRKLGVSGRTKAVGEALRRGIAHLTGF